MLDADAGETELGLAKLVRVFANENDALVEAENSCGPGCVLAGEGDVQGAGDVGHGELHCGAGVEDDGAFGLEAQASGAESGLGAGSWSREEAP